MLDFAIYLGSMASAAAYVLSSDKILKPFQRARLLVFLNPKLDPQGVGYNLNQSKIAVGSGELFGKGLYHGTQTQLNFVPENSRDFIFTAIGEEAGFLGALRSDRARTRSSSRAPCARSLRPRTASGCC